MEFIFFDHNDVELYRRSDALDAHHIEEEYRHTGTFPDDEKPIEHGMRVGWTDENGALQFFEIRQPQRSQPAGTVAYEAEHVAVAELSDCIVEDKRSYNVTASTALAGVLAGTGWQLGTVDANPTGSANFYFVNAWAALQTIRDAWGVALLPRLTYAGAQITGRYIDIRARMGASRGVRLSLDRNVGQAGITYDDRDLVTALYGRGKGEVVGETAAGVDTYGRKITFEDVAWSKAAGDPADKPAGQKYVEDPAATAAFGRKGRARFGVVEFGSCEDPAELLRLTWAALQERNHPKITIDMSVTDLARIGYAREGMSLGDDVDVIIDPWQLETRARVVKLDRDLLCPESTKPTIGDYRADITYKNVQTNTAAQIGQQIAQNAPSLLQGYIDTAVLGIMSSKTKRETLPDGSEMYVTADGAKAVRFAGGGILLASAKDSAGNWVWRTALTGSGIVADEITAGTLRAALVTILGNENVYMAGANIYVLDPANHKHQIRIGQFDGTRTGIGFTTDGGATWTQTIDYTGISISSDIPDGSISSQKLADNAVTGTKISAGSITTPKIATAGLNASVIKAGTIDANSVSIAGTGTSLNGTTLRIKHPSINAGAETTIGLEGLKMILNGKVIGGMYKDTDGSVISATSALLNTTSWPLFRVLVGSASGIGYAMPSIELKYGSATGGYIGVPTTYDGTSMGLGLQSMQDMYLDALGDINLSAFDSVVDDGGGIFMSAGKKGMAFSYTRADGTTGKVTLKQLDDFFNS